MKKTTVYYSDILNDEFSGIGKRPEVVIDRDYKYENNSVLYKIARFIVYRLVMKNVAALYCKYKFNYKIIGKEKLNGYCDKGLFLYGNHTQVPGDGYMPNIICKNRDVCFVVNPDNVAAKGTKTFMSMMGTIPIPTAINGFKKFNELIEKRYRENWCIVIYPEAHIWPYCNFVRPFPATSFKYPAKLNAPVFCFTNVYSKSKKGKPQITSYIDGPFISQKVAIKERQEELHALVLNAMQNRAENCNSYAFIEYKERGYK